MIATCVQTTAGRTMGGVGAATGGRGAGAEPTRGAARRLAAGAAAGGAGLRLHTSGTLCTLQCISSLEGHTGTECRQGGPAALAGRAAALTANFCLVTDGSCEASRSLLTHQ